MKKKYFPIFICLLSLFMGINGCNREETIPYVAPADDPIPTNSTDSLILSIKKQYQTKIIYKWDRRYVSTSAKASPPLFEKVLPFINYIQDYWIGAYDSQNPEFCQNNLPIEVVLVGSLISYTNGEELDFNAAGQAASLSRMLLSDVNNLNTGNKQWIKANVPTMHHEFAHIIDKKYGRPDGFDEVSAGLYAVNIRYSTFTEQEARDRGFWRNYGMSNEAEDFATYVEGIISTPKAEVLKIVSQNSKLERKYKLVYNHYKNMGIDLHELYNYLAKRWDEQTVYTNQ